MRGVLTGYNGIPQRTTNRVERISKSKKIWIRIPSPSRRGGVCGKDARRVEPSTRLNKGNWSWGAITGSRHSNELAYHVHSWLYWKTAMVCTETKSLRHSLIGEMMRLLLPQRTKKKVNRPEATLIAAYKRKGNPERQRRIQISSSQHLSSLEQASVVGLHDIKRKRSGCIMAHHRRSAALQVSSVAACNFAKWGKLTRRSSGKDDHQSKHVSEAKSQTSQEAYRVMG